MKTGEAAVKLVNKKQIGTWRTAVPVTCEVLIVRNLTGSPLVKKESKRSGSSINGRSIIPPVGLVPKFKPVKIIFYCMLIIGQISFQSKVDSLQILIMFRHINDSNMKGSKIR